MWQHVSLTTALVNLTSSNTSYLEYYSAVQVVD